MSLGIRWLERDIFETNPALDARVLRRGVVSGNGGGGAHRAAFVRLLEDRRRRPGPLPAAWRAAYDDSLNRAVARLVLDDVLRLRWRSSFIGGAGAHPRLFRSARTDARDHLTSGRSLDVLEAAAALPVDAAPDLLIALYFGHRMPVTPAVRRRFPSPRRTLSRLLEGATTTTRRLLDARWRMTPPASGAVWLSWSQRAGLPRQSSDLTYKLYISPTLPRLGDAFRAALPVFAAHDVRTFKVGCDAYHLVRPDKFVAYVETQEQLVAVASALRAALGGIDAHGVPFCAAAGGDETGLISWGVDFTGVVASGDERTSWRWWLCERLARFLSAAKRHGQMVVSPVRFALDRLTLDGIDVTTFTPTPDFLVEAAIPSAVRRSR